MRKPTQRELENIVGHFLYYLSNEPDPKTGISPRTRFYGEQPVEAKMLFPDVSDEIILSAVQQAIDLRRQQVNLLPRAPDGSWRSYS